MSLINKVINDLEARQAFAANTTDRIFQGLSAAKCPQPEKRLASAELFIVMLFLVASVSATYALMGNRAGQVLAGIKNVPEIPGPAGETIHAPQLFSEKITDSADNMNKPADFVEESAAKTNLPLKLALALSSPGISVAKAGEADKIEPAAAIAKVESIELGKQENRILLTLRLASEVDYRAYSLSDPDRIVVEIDDAVFAGVLPALGDYAAIKGIRLKRNRAGKLKLVIDTASAYTIAAVDLIPATGAYALHLALVNKKQEPGEDSLLADQLVGESETIHPVNAEYGKMTRDISVQDAGNRSGEMYTHAEELYRLGKTGKANELLTALLDKDEGNRAARSLLAQRLIEQGQLARAEVLLKAGLQSQGGDAEWTNLYARLLVKRGDINAAIDILNRVTPDIHSDPDYYALLAALYQKSGRHQAAVRAYRRLVQLRPANSIWWMGLAISLESLQQNTEALFAYNKALEGNRISQELQKYVHGKINYLNKRG